MLAPLSALEIKVQSSLNVTQGLPKDGFPLTLRPYSMASVFIIDESSDCPSPAARTLERVTLWEIY